MEILLVLVLLGLFVGPSAYRMYEKYKARKRGDAKAGGKEGPSYLRRMLGMLTPVFLLIVFLVALAVGFKVLEARGTIAPLPTITFSPQQPSPTPE